MDNYVGLNEIGRGTSGSATRARAKHSGKTVVIKRISMLYMDGQERDDALVEVSVLRKLGHPSIVKHYDSFMDSSTLCIVMEYAEGGDLSAYIKLCKKSGSGIPELRVLRWFTQIVSGIAHIHSKNIMHRDLKPQNIFIASSGRRVLIGDFGVCKVLEKKSDLTQTITGTPYYLSPEIFQQKPYSMKSDIWAIGCVLYEMVALRVPFDAVDFQSLGALVMRGSNPPFPPTYSKDLRNIFYDIMKRDYRARPSADDLLSTQLIKQTQLSLSSEANISEKENIPCTNKRQLPPLSPGVVRTPSPLRSLLTHATRSPLISPRNIPLSPRNPQKSPNCGVTRSTSSTAASHRCRSASVEKPPLPPLLTVYNTRSCSPAPRHDSRPANRINNIPTSPSAGILRLKATPTHAPPMYPKPPITVEIRTSPSTQIKQRMARSPMVSRPPGRLY